jgi:hypothetical protein
MVAGNPQGGGRKWGSTMEGPNGKFIQSTGEMFGRFAAELMPKLVV